MSSIVTEIANIPLQGGVDIESPSSDASKTLSTLLDLLRNAKGAQQVFWSRQVEHPDILEILIDWDDYNAFEEFPKTPEFEKFLALLPQIAAGAPSLKNVRFRTAGGGIRNINTSGVLEVTTTYLPLDVDVTAYEKIVDSFVPQLAQNSEGLLGTATGWVVEEQDDPVNGGAKLKAFVVCFAWESIEAHVAATQVAANKEAIVPWKAAIKHVEMHHIKARE